MDREESSGNAGLADEVAKACAGGEGVMVMVPVKGVGRSASGVRVYVTTNGTMSGSFGDPTGIVTVVVLMLNGTGDGTGNLLDDGEAEIVGEGMEASSTNDNESGPQEIETWGTDTGGMDGMVTKGTVIVITVPPIPPVTVTAERESISGDLETG
jgi:hypothetical protein